jgi:hypothetical protein
MISIRRVSVIGEWHKNLQYLKRRLLNTPPKTPNAKEANASVMKLPAIMSGVLPVNSVFESDYTVLNRMILTISLKTPSPYTIEKSLG